VKTGTIYGKVHQDGKAVRNILVEVMIGSCFSPVFKVLSTNNAGFYRVDNVRVDKPAHVAVNGFSKSNGGLNKRYQANCGKGVMLRAGQLNRHNIALISKPDDTEQQCATAGGTWFFNIGFRGCSYPYNDGGKACTDGKQCQDGTCLATSRDQSATTGVCPAATSSAISNCSGMIRNSRWFPKPCA